MKKKVAFKTLGCRLNQFETDSILTDFYRAGYDVVPFNEKADVYIINTCTVTSRGDHKSKSAINHALKNKEESLVLVTGCMAESRKDDLEQLDGITYVVGNKKKASIHSLVQAYFNGEIMGIDYLEEDAFGFSVAEKSFHTRSMVKIQEGCNDLCAFCIVPVVRGRAASRPVNEILENIKCVLDFGYKEIVLTGVNISRYQHEGVDFVDLIEKILYLNGQFRLRISSIEPEAFRVHFYELFEHEKICPHLHLCLQSGSDTVLSRMKRNYSLSSFMQIINELRKRYPLFNLTTDVMVGFPGETEADFKATCDAVRQIGFSHIHTFKYSVRQGTRAANMQGQVPERIKSERSKIIREISNSNKMKYRNMLLGRKQTVLVEKVSADGFAKGYGEHYVPVVFNTSLKENNYFVTVLLNEIKKDSKEMPIFASLDSCNA